MMAIRPNKFDRPPPNYNSRLFPHSLSLVSVLPVANIFLNLDPCLRGDDGRVNDQREFQSTVCDRKAQMAAGPARLGGLLSDTTIRTQKFESAETENSLDVLHIV